MKQFVEEALSRMILSASGWRGVFAVDGSEESSAPQIAAAHEEITRRAAWVFADFIKQKTGIKNPAVIVGMDSRPTGPAIAGIAAASLAGCGCEVLWAGIAAAPEIMAYARSLAAENSSVPNAGGFIYISASHNPVGHNGLKFGLLDGGVLGGEDAALLIAAFKSSFEQTLPPAAAARQAMVKEGALAAYRAFIGEVISGDGIDEQALRTVLCSALVKKPLGVVCDFNGSARAASIDLDFFTALNIKFQAINATAGAIAHRIVPEGESLLPCCRFLEACHQKDGVFLMGYVPDCDGDRGNLVVWDETLGAARPLEAQEVFALACVSELSHLAWTGRAKQAKIAVAVNDGTSMRIDRIAESFGAQVFRAEIGEANVVALARKLRKEGYVVRILGEGAAGGNITYPSSVRDPLSTVMAMVKLLTIPDFYQPGAPPSLSAVIAALPRWTTTGAYSANAVLQIKAGDHSILKKAYQDIFQQQWAQKQALFHQRGLTRWQAFRYNGTEECCCNDDFGSAGRGGLRICFYGETGPARSSIWMRGSGTEPVFRVMADAEGADDGFEAMLIDWQRQMVLEADRIALNLC